MSFGRGRGGWSSGGGGRFNYNITPKPFELWPDIVLPKVNSNVEEVEEREEDLTISSYWKTSPYHLVEETITQKNESNFEVETFADWKKTKRKASKRDMFQFLQLHLRNFPKELIGDCKSQCRVPKRVRWSAEQDLIKLDELAKREQEQKLKDHEGKGEKEKKDGDEDEDEDDDEAKEDEEESSDGGDYDKNIDFDDDEDDFNMVDDGNDDDDAVY